MHDSAAIYSITSLTTSLKNLIEGGFPFVWVKGQVADLSRPSSGHVYFSLKDDNASLNAVWFRGAQSTGAKFDPLTGEVYEDGPRPSLAGSLQNGQEIICAGRLTIYAQRGAYQMVVELAHDAGMGALHIQFEYLCKKLREAGYFDESRKRAIPINPPRVAVITAPTGAAIHDFLRTAETRGFGSTISIYPALMQGEGAPAQIIKQINKVNTDGLADVIVLIRGGGSLEDLQAFNNEEVATAIKDSALPILAGIGHEVDFTLADMTADKRASTPTQAAHILWSDRQELIRLLATSTRRLESIQQKHLEKLTSRIRAIQRFILARSPYYRLENWELQLTTFSSRLQRAVHSFFAVQHQNILQKNSLLDTFENRLERENSRLQELTKRLEYCNERYFERKTVSLEKSVLLLDANNPLLPLQRGYALIQAPNGNVVASVKTLKKNDQLHITMADGAVTTTINTITKNPPTPPAKASSTQEK